MYIGVLFVGLYMCVLFGFICIVGYMYMIVLFVGCTVICILVLCLWVLQFLYVSECGLYVY
jgi:hypothetical protein